MQNDLKFSGDMPVVINYQGSSDDIYAPVRSSSCDIELVAKHILDDLYTARKDEICVRVKKGNTTIWEGYKQPNTYSQPVTQNLDAISVTCIDPVSILKFVKIDKLMDKPSIKTYGELIGLALAYVMIDVNKLMVERTVSYGGAYDGTNGLLNLSCQVSNFWDEAGEPSNAYDMIAEMLRPFCLALVHAGDSYQIYDVNKTTGTRTFDVYTIGNNGTLTSTGTSTETKASELYDSQDWKSNNTQEPTIEINNTYEKVNGVASTMIPEYSRMVFDVVDYNQRTRYSYFQMNVQKNKTKGYITTTPNNYQIDADDKWFYIWNGVYTDDNYLLRSHTNDGDGYLVNGYLNINKANYYLTGDTGHPNDYGSILNFYGGAANGNANGKQQTTDKSVVVKKCITAYAPDNGVPLEYLELADLDWDFDGNTQPDYGDNENPVTMDPEYDKNSPSNSKFGEAKTMQQSNKVTYSQEYNISVSANDEYTIELDLAQSYSRTGMDVAIDIWQNNTATDKMFLLAYRDSDTGKWYPFISTADTKYFPKRWNASEVIVDRDYFDRYRTTAAQFRPSRCKPVWDRRRINMYIELPNQRVLQFNGKEWVSDLHPENGNAFWLCKLMNGSKLFHNKHRYNIIECSDGDRYSLGEEDFSFYTDEAGGYVDEYVSGASQTTYKPYASEENDWWHFIDECSDGHLSIKMPEGLPTANIKVYVVVYNSTMLGMTGSSTTNGYGHTEPFIYEISGQGKYYDDDQGRYVTITLGNNNTMNYGVVREDPAKVEFMPYNTTYVKAEHLDLDISVTVPESNLGQMFEESDIKYVIDSQNDYVEEYEGPSFLVNTYNPLVNSSFSYLIFGYSLADPYLFKINGQDSRPESYTVQAYMNWLGTIRKTYSKTIIPESRTRGFSNIRTFIESPEIGGNELMVIADSWDVKTGRHSVIAIEDQDMQVSEVTTVDYFELPRRARAERWNLPTATK